MTAEMRITWEGTLPGLAEHTVSLEHWLKPLEALLVAVKRTASQMIADAVDDTEYGARGGRLTETARLIDLQMVAVEDGSTTVALRCTQPPATQQELFGDFAARTLDRVLDNIEAESRGEVRSAVARRFLAIIPTGVTKQTFRLDANGYSRVVEIGDSQIAELPPELPILRDIEAEIIAIGVARPAITLKPSEGARQLTFEATEQQVEFAFAHRHERVRATCTLGEPHRLIDLRPHTAGPLPTPSPQQRTTLFLTRWAQTLELLGR